MPLTPKQGLLQQNSSPSVAQRKREGGQKWSSFTKMFPIFVNAAAVAPFHMIPCSDMTDFQSLNVLLA